ncbi:MAG: hypothetical protein FWC68_04240 [Oscillospiraceae bacterium]|nr:hypothetical protein [Oscillospiraceae bacterium]
MKILIITNMLNKQVAEDVLIAKSFFEDNNEVAVVNMDYNESLDEMYDVIIRRNTWYDDESKMKYYYIQTKKLCNRLLNKSVCKINFNGNFDTSNKTYLVDLFDKGYPVIPSVHNLEDLDKLARTETYMLKPIEGYDGVGQAKLAKDELINKFNENYIIQPVMEFGSEVQFYFVGTKYQYALEFKPSKVPIYPEPTIYNCSEEELEIATRFAKLNSQLVGVQRIDFIKLENGELLLLEIEDTAPHLELKSASEEAREQFLRDYKNMVYNEVNS